MHQAYAQEYLRNMSEEECVRFIKNSNVEIPDTFRNNDKLLGEFVRDTIDCLLDNPNCVFMYSFYPTLKFAEDIRTLFADSYQLDSSDSSIASRLATYTLQYNSVQNADGEWVSSGGAWQDRWYYYNCYAYSINRFESPQVYDSNWLQYNIGVFCGEEIESLYGLSIEDLANVVKKDLEALQYKNVEIFDGIPSTTEDNQLICIRKSSSDYHFMKYDLKTDAWYHKPGRTAILKYNYTPSNDCIWKSEGSYEGVERSYNGQYDSNILYIKYDKHMLDISNNNLCTNASSAISAGKDIIFEMNIGYVNSYNFEVTADSLLTVNLYDQNMLLLDTYNGINNVFSYNFSKTGKYYIGVSFAEKSYCGECTIKVHIHYYTGHKCLYCNNYNASHNYNDKYTWLDYTKHKATCTCGDSVESGHVVKAATGNQKYTYCLLCKGRAERGFIVDPLSNTTLMMTINGSYILPNGITVLQDADVKAYFRGTLKFYVFNGQAVA